MSMVGSLYYHIKEANFNPVSVVHGLSYLATVTYLRVLMNLLKIGSDRFRNHVSETYHNKVVRLGDAAKFVTINENLELKNLDKVLPYTHAKDIILKNPGNIVAYECACRSQKKDACKPTEVCLVVGEPFVDLVRMFQPFRSRRITPEEALRIMKEEDDKGHIHTAWFKTAMLNRFYAICNCCRCCCLGTEMMFRYNMKTVMPSGYVASIGDDCGGCGECERYCQFDAIETVRDTNNGKERKRCRVILDNCFGCGVCESKCKKENIALTLDKDKGIPLDIEDLVKRKGELN